MDTVFAHYANREPYQQFPNFQ